MAAKTPERVLGIRAATLSLLCALLAAAGACRKADKLSYRTYSSPGGEVTCEAPSDWKGMQTFVDGAYLCISSPEAVNEIAARLIIERPLGKTTRQELEQHLAERLKEEGDDPYFSLSALTTVRIGEFEGLSYTVTFLNSVQSAFLHRTTPPPPPVPHRNTEIYLETPGGPLWVSYDAPLAIYDKYRPAFDRLLKTFRWTGGAARRDRTSPDPPAR